MDKYKNAISKIKASDEFKNNLIEKMNERQAENTIKVNNKYAKKNKVRKAITSIIGIIGILLGGGLAYAGITGNLKFGDTGIEFSQNIEEYQVAENQKLECDGNIIELTSKVCDDGFVILQFDVTLSDEQSNMSEETCGLQYISFNDEIVNEYGYEDTRLAGANYNLIIDGEEYWLRGATDSQIITNIENKNYTCYQLWFLSDTEIGDKEEFTITLDDVRLMVGDNLINFDGKFDIDLSKTKALDNSTTYNLDDVAITYERLTANVEKIIESPMQTLIKLRRTLDDVTSKNFANLSEDDYVGDLIYEVYDQDGNQISEYNLITKYVYYYKDGTTKETDNEEGYEYDGFYKYDTEEYIVIAQDDTITNLTVEVFEVNEYKGTTRNIGEYNINLTNGKVATKNKNQITEVNENAPINWEIDTILVSDIEEFSINIDEDYEIIRQYDIVNQDGMSACEGNEETANVITYQIELKDTGAYFALVLFRDKSIYNTYDLYISGDIDYKPTKIKANSQYILVLNALTDYNYNLIKDIVDTIEWK